MDGQQTTKPTPIVQPEPSGEAEGVLSELEARIVKAVLANDLVEIRAIEKEMGEKIIEEGPPIQQPPKKKRGIWNWLRKLVTQIKRNGS